MATIVVASLEKMEKQKEKKEKGRNKVSGYKINVSHMMYITSYKEYFEANGTVMIYSISVLQLCLMELFYQFTFYITYECNQSIVSF